MTNIDHPHDATEAFLAGQLGPACLERFRDPALREELNELLASGTELEDAILRIIHREASQDRAIADEFFAHFLSALMRIGHFSMSDGLRRFVETGDLVNSIAGSLWRDLADLKFRTRREFLSYCGQRLQWKAADRARGLNSGRRREDLHREVDFEAAGLQEKDKPGPSTIVGNSEDKERLILAMVRLPPRDREILSRHLRGEDHAQVAEALQLSPAAARKALQRAIEKAQGLL